jgi:hypothetical protein
LFQNQWLLRVDNNLYVTTLAIHSLVLLLLLNADSVVEHFDAVFDSQVLFLARVSRQLTCNYGG